VLCAVVSAETASKGLGVEDDEGSASDPDVFAPGNWEMICASAVPDSKPKIKTAGETVRKKTRSDLESAPCLTPSPLQLSIALTPNCSLRNRSAG
jgi:hypothetical protein